MVHSKITLYLLQDGCIFVANAWALQGLTCHDFSVYVYTEKLHETLEAWVRFRPVVCVWALQGHFSQTFCPLLFLSYPPWASNRIHQFQHAWVYSAPQRVLKPAAV